MNTLGIEVKDSIVVLQYEINKLATTVKVIMMAMGKTFIVGDALKCKGKLKFPKSSQMWGREMPKRMNSVLIIWNKMW